MSLKLYNVDFDPMWPVGECLVILANNETEAKDIASKTIRHTNDFSIEELPMESPKVVVYLSGDY